MSAIVETTETEPPRTSGQDVPAGTGSPAVCLSRGALSIGQLLAVFGFCLLFLYHNYLPLFHSDLWGHVAYGDWILTHGRLPDEDPFAELAAGVPVIDTAWLSQVLLALAGRGPDAEWLAHLFALTVLVASVVLARAACERSGQWGVGVACSALAFGIAWSRHAVQRPEMFGQLCFAALLWLVVRSGLMDGRVRGNQPVSGGEGGWLWHAAVFLLFMAWANLHGSFIVGLAVLAVLALGRAIDRLIACRSLSATVCHAEVQRGLTALELAVLGACCNPYGFDLVLRTLVFPVHPNLAAVMEWFPLEMASLEGIPMALSWILTTGVFRHSRRRVSPSEVGLLLLFNAAVCLRVRMIAWYAPVLAIVLAPHLAEIAARFGLWERCQWAWLVRKSHRLTLMAVLLVWMTFVFSPISRPVLGGDPRPATQVFSHQTPLGATNWLLQHPPEGLVYAPQWWGDWLVWRGPQGLRVMATTNVIHLLPSQVWQDYLAIATADRGWEDRLDRYRINTVVVSRELQSCLVRAVEQATGWTVVYEDSVSVIAVRSTRPQTESGNVTAPLAASGTTAPEGNRP
uniref:Glycosyltransferase RgtA/B/C/D-like domain-containing protein n=1 Tax=Schlesneria paludicola TaxID=360056 RepID=A0A7C2JYF8_9PLAN